jgi:hypothetical protein
VELPAGIAGQVLASRKRRLAGKPIRLAWDGAAEIDRAATNGAWHRRLLS